MDHGLFAVDIFAGFHGVDSGLFVPVVGRGDDHGVNIVAGEDLVVVAGREDVAAPDLFRVFKAAVVTVRGGNELDAGNLNGRARVALALTACADKRNLDMVVGGDGLGGRGLRGSQCVDARAEKGGRRSGAGRGSSRRRARRSRRSGSRAGEVSRAWTRLDF